MFAVASVGLVLIEEAALPIGMSDTPRGHLVNALYKPPGAGSGDARAERLKWAIEAGGDV